VRNSCDDYLNSVDVSLYRLDYRFNQEKELAALDIAEAQVRALAAIASAIAELADAIKGLEFK